MDVIAMIILTLQITSVISKKSHKKRSRDSSSESIENLLYYQDCNHKETTTTTTTEKQALRQPAPPPQPECPCPKMCCSMRCDCSPNQSFAGRQMQPQSPMMPLMQPVPPHQPSMSVQPQLIQRGKKKKRPIMDPQNMLPPIGGRRDLGFTREDIKNLISQDSDIKSILKDLVRVTMKKVDLVEQVKSGKPLEKPAIESKPLDMVDSGEDEEEF